MEIIYDENYNGDDAEIFKYQNSEVWRLYTKLVPLFISHCVFFNADSTFSKTTFSQIEKYQEIFYSDLTGAIENRRYSDWQVQLLKTVFCIDMIFNDDESIENRKRLLEEAGEEDVVRLCMRFFCANKEKMDFLKRAQQYDYFERHPDFTLLKYIDIDSIGKIVEPKFYRLFNLTTKEELLLKSYLCLMGMKFKQYKGIEEIDLSDYTLYLLKQSGIDSIDELYGLTDEGLQSIEGLTNRGIDEIKQNKILFQQSQD